MHKSMIDQALDTNPYRVVQKAMRPALVTVLAFSAVINVLMLTGSVYMLQVYDRVLSSGSVPTLIGLFAIVAILYAFLALYDFLRTRILSRSALKIDQQLGLLSFSRWLKGGLPDDQAQHKGEPLRDLDVIRSFVASPAITAVFDLPFVPLFLAVLFIIHPWLGMLTVGGAIVGAILAVANRKLTQSALREAATRDSIERDFADRTRRGAEAIVAMGMQQTVTHRWRKLHEYTLATGQAGSDPAEMLASASRTFRMLLQSAMLTLGAFLVLQNQISAGMIIASSILSGRALAPVDQLIGQWRGIGRAVIAHRRLDAAFENVEPEPERIDLADPTGQITVDGLTKLGSERDTGDRAQILNDVSFSLAPGEGLGVIGNSASGKSTLARLLVGAGQADAGEIRLDGATPDQWDPIRLGRKIGYLPQVLEMLPGSVRDNIARFDPQATDKDVIAAAKLTGVHEMILNLPQGYGTHLAVSGEPSPLSGGQLQRVGLARAVFGMPALVILDEPNSNLDVAGDAALTETISALRDAGSVVIVMAHRPSALAAVNKLMILSSGSVKKFGNKEDVLKPPMSGAAKPAPRHTASPAVAAKKMAPPHPIAGEKDRKVSRILEPDEARARSAAQLRTAQATSATPTSPTAHAPQQPTPVKRAAGADMLFRTQAKKSDGRIPAKNTQQTRSAR